MQAVREHPYHNKLQLRGCSCLRSLAINEKTRQAILHNGGMKIINERTRQAIVHNGGMEIVVAAMQNHPEQTPLLDQCCSALLSFTDRQENQQKVAELGAVAALVHAMKWNPEHQGIQRAGCETLSNIATSADPRLIAAEGAIEAALWQLARCPDNCPRIAEALWQLARCPGIAEALWQLARCPDNCPRIAEVGLDTICAAMLHNPNRAAVHHRAMGCIRFLAAHPECHSITIKRALACILNSMKGQRSQVEVQEEGCAALLSLTAKSSSSRIRVGAGGGVDAIIQAMKAHTEHQDIQRMGCDALVLFAMGGNKRLIKEAGGVGSCLEAMRNFPDEVHLQRRGCALMFEMADNPEALSEVEEQEALDLIPAFINRDSSDKAEALELILAFINRDTSDKAIVDFGSRVLRKLGHTMTTTFEAGDGAKSGSDAAKSGSST
ncbi:armadillo-type protein [Baffinella frigidus]|nr:armadillo-type protein [Cryptophyta sp. CCMP2293]